jgi:hypothetical protein
MLDFDPYSVPKEEKILKRKKVAGERGELGGRRRKYLNNEGERGHIMTGRHARRAGEKL